MTDNPNIDPEGIDVETCLAQLRDPAVLLAEALHRVHRADGIQDALDRLAQTPFIAEEQAMAERLAVRQDHLTHTADTLAYIAKAAADMAAQEPQRTMAAIEDFLSGEDLRPVPAAEYEPQAVNGVRFTVSLTEGYRYLGMVAGREWVYLTGYGFADVGGFDQHESEAGFTASGRVVSATPDHVLCVTDSGVSVALPRALIVESADE